MSASSLHLPSPPTPQTNSLFMQSARSMLQFNFVLTQDASKDDDGPYRLSLENTLGNDSAVIKIQVNGECALPISSIQQASGQIWLFVPVKLKVVTV